MKLASRGLTVSGIALVAAAGLGLLVNAFFGSDVLAGDVHRTGVPETWGKIVGRVIDAHGVPYFDVGVGISIEDITKPGVAVGGELGYVGPGIGEGGRFQEWVPPGRYLVYAVVDLKDGGRLRTATHTVTVNPRSEAFVELQFSRPQREFHREDQEPFDP